MVNQSGAYPLILIGAVMLIGIPLWARSMLRNGTATQHGGQESTILSTHTTMLHHGMVIVGLPYSNPEISIMGEITGGGPYGAGTVTGPDGSRMPSANELAAARAQGRYVAEIAARLVHHH